MPARAKPSGTRRIVMPGSAGAVGQITSCRSEKPMLQIVPSLIRATESMNTASSKPPALARR
jgi:hypothetical protein